MGMLSGFLLFNPRERNPNKMLFSDVVNRVARFAMSTVRSMILVVVDMVVHMMNNANERRKNTVLAGRY